MSEAKPTELNLDQTYAMTRQKLIVVGDVAVGKTSIVNSFLGHVVKDEYEPSIGVDFFSKTVKFKGKVLKLQIWDSAGQEKFKSLIPNYIRGSAIIFIIYDITNAKSFENIPKWINFINDIDSANLVLCGNKIDLNEMRKVDYGEGEKLARSFGCQFFEVSAKKDLNVQKMLYSSVVELPFFQTYKTERTRMEDIVGELAMENNETKGGANSSIVDTTRNEINIKGGLLERKKKLGKCKC